MEEIMYTKNYEEFRKELDVELCKTAESFVRIGYLLKVARDTDILKESPYNSVNEFARVRYNLDKTQVSRFIHINDKFSKGGYSEDLEDQYKGFGYAKLTIMLQLPEGINRELSADYSKAEIQGIKDEIDAENNISDIEVLLEGQDPAMAETDNELYRAVRQLGEDAPELFCDVFHAAEVGLTQDVMKEIMAPAGEKIYSIRIRGMGRFMLAVKENDSIVPLINIRTMERQEYPWESVLAAWKDIVNSEETDPEKVWETLYDMEFPKKEEVAPVQQSQTVPKPVKKESKVQKAPKRRLKKAEKPEKTEWEQKIDKCEQAAEEQIPGQDNIMNHPELLPDKESMENVTEMAEIVSGEPENVISQQENVTRQPEEYTEAAGMEELYRKAKDNIRSLNEEVNEHCGTRRASYLTKERVKSFYDKAIAAAVLFEKMLNGWEA